MPGAKRHLPPSNPIASTPINDTILSDVTPGPGETNDLAPPMKKAASNAANGEIVIPPPQPVTATETPGGQSRDEKTPQNGTTGLETETGPSAVASVAGATTSSREGTRAVDSSLSVASCEREAVAEADTRTSKDYYFDSYSHHGIHEEMLKDEVRTRTYQMAILNNRQLFHGKTVLDVGCGTGILSMFAVQAGASHVYAVDCSSIIEQAAKIIKANDYSDRITLIQSKMEDVELPIPHVDIIISEWMGYFLLYESMLNTVLYARDKWLRPGGLIFPDKAVIYLSAVEQDQIKKERIDFWENVYGFDMSALKEVALLEPVVDVVDADSVVTNAVPILNIDILTCTEEDLSFITPFQLRANRSDYIHAFVAFFECAFTRIPKPLGFSTSPHSMYTHWKQTIFYLRDAITICEGEVISGRIECRSNKKNERDLDIGLEFNFEGRRQNVNKRVEFRLR